jgi:hypothetical protein
VGREAVGSPSAPAPAAIEARTGQAVTAALVVALAHIVFSWGYITIPWGDNGRWLYEIDRVAHGAVPYRDVYWGFPPLAPWLLGGLARWLGSDLTPIWTITSAITLTIAVTYGAIVARLIPGRLAVPVAGTGMLLGVAFAHQNSAPLALGMYTPAAPVALCCLFLQVLAFVRDWARPRVSTALLVGALGGAGFLAKHDVWFPCLWLTLAAGVVTPDPARPRMTRMAAAGGGFVLTAGSGLAVLAAMHGVGALPDIFSGYGQIAELSGINLPTLSSLTVEAASFGLCLAVVALISRVTGLSEGRANSLLVIGGAMLFAAAGGLWLWKADQIGQAMLVSGDPRVPTALQMALRPVDPSAFDRFRYNFGVFRLQLLRHLVPLLVPLAVLAVALARRRAVRDLRRWRLLVVLLIACVALRARRMISFTEWSELMLEAPVYGFALTVLSNRAERLVNRTVWVACGVLLAAGLDAHWRLGRGFGSQRGILPEFQTARGMVRIEPGLARELVFVRSLADRADPSGRRPIFSFVYSSGFSYLLGRPSAGSLTHGFRFSLYPSADSAYRAVEAEKDRLILVDRQATPRSVEATDFAPWRWEARMVEDHYLRVDRPLFERLKSGCTPVTPPADRASAFSVFDCAPSAGR